MRRAAASMSPSVLGRGDRVALGGVGDDDAVLGSRLYVYVVDTDAARPMALSFPARSITSAVTCVALRIMRPS